MAIEVPNVAEVLMLQYLVNMIGTDGNAAPVGGQRLLRLFTSNTTPVETSLLTDFTEVNPLTGYAPVTLVGSQWTTTYVSSVATAVYSERIFTFTTSVTLYGYYVTTIELTPRLLWVERFTNAPFQLPDGGGEVGVSPRLTLN